MAKLKTERHHWWPRCVSKFWMNADGGVHWLLPDGGVRTSAPENFGVIGGGHHIKLSWDPGSETTWDESFEPEFQRADENFPGVINWLDSLSRESRPNAPMTQRFLWQGANEGHVAQLIECLVSLAVRSPMNREASVAVAEQIRGKLPERERNTIIAANMRFAQRNAMRSIGNRGKIAVIYSPEHEFIFGDGFYHNIKSPAYNIYSTRILAPITPRISVLFAQPMRYSDEPILSTLVVTAEEALALNHTVQIYARQAIFFRSDKPIIAEEYRSCQHLEYASVNNPIDVIIDSIPGVVRN